MPSLQKGKEAILVSLFKKLFDRRIEVFIAEEHLHLAVKMYVTWQM